MFSGCRTQLVEDYLQTQRREGEHKVKATGRLLLDGEKCFSGFCAKLMDNYLDVGKKMRKVSSVEGEEGVQMAVSIASQDPSTCLRLSHYLQRENTSRRGVSVVGFRLAAEMEYLYHHRKCQ